MIDPPLPERVRHAVTTTAYGRYTKVVLRVRPQAAAAWQDLGGGLFTLLTDSPIGCVYLASGFDEAPADRDLVITLLLHARFARRLHGLSSDAVVAESVKALDAFCVLDAATGRQVAPFAGIGRHVTWGRSFSYPRAVAAWPLSEGRSRFDDLARALREPHGRILVGGDTTENSHSEGALLAARRMTDQLLTTIGGMAQT